MFYTVIEVQNSGTPACLTTVYESENAALAAYFTICAAASVSTIPYHSAHILQSNGLILRQEIFDRREVST